MINQYNLKLTWTKGSQECASILGVCKFLLPIYLQLLRYGYSANSVDMEEYSLGLWSPIL